jgi:hypothetical protein
MRRLQRTSTIDINRPEVCYDSSMQSSFVTRIKNRVDGKGYTVSSLVKAQAPFESAVYVGDSGYAGLRAPLVIYQIKGHKADFKAMHELIATIVASESIETVRINVVANYHVFKKYGLRLVSGREVHQLPHLKRSFVLDLELQT